MPSFGTPTYAGRSAGTNALDIPVPADLADGQLLIVALRAQETGDLPWIPPEGFVLVSPEPFLPNASVRVGAVFAKQVSDASAEPATHTFTGPGSRAVAIAIACTPDHVGPIAPRYWGPYGGSAQSGGVVTLDHLSGVITETPNLSIVALGAECTPGVSHVPTETPAGYVEIGNAQSSLDESTAGSRTSLWLGWRADLSAEVEVLSGGFAGASAPALYIGVLAGGGIAGPAGGFRSVAQMLATPGATWAHRGGSANWPEMSALAYRNAALAGYGALEFSCGRSVDGVWFGLHDATLNRTSGTTDLPNVNTMTWAQIQEHMITVNANGDPQPYFKMTDFLDIYASTHVVIMDIKYGWSFAAEWFDILKSYTGDRQRIIVKYFGPTSFSAQMRDYVRSAGFASWGYYYPSDFAAGAVEPTQGHWSMLGMDYTASQADWDALAAYGKPIVGHIAPSQAAYDTARAKGARMVQCADVAGIAPVGAVDTGQPWDAVYAGLSRIPARIV